MVKLSTLVILAGVVMLVFPIPPVATGVGGLAVIVVGVLLRLLTDQ
ncbi:transporter [Natrinema salsiterrestre]|uniref:Transporter n=1 Tax=Natrinema salsiterrestre TaxID=2950540 RepID=A0A9Q4L0S7_9EURY|nr:transporter [Natrinema salsiterrestre]MDF9745419.1 transporter [Natrinema salsiterrestre]